MDSQDSSINRGLSMFATIQQKGVFGTVNPTLPLADSANSELLGDAPGREVLWGDQHHKVRHPVRLDRPVEERGHGFGAEALTPEGGKDRKPELRRILGIGAEILCVRWSV